MYLVCPRLHNHFPERTQIPYSNPSYPRSSIPRTLSTYIHDEECLFPQSTCHSRRSTTPCRSRQRLHNLKAEMAASKRNNRRAVREWVIRRLSLLILAAALMAAVSAAAAVVAVLPGKPAATDAASCSGTRHVAMAVAFSKLMLEVQIRWNDLESTAAEPIRCDFQ